MVAAAGIVTVLSLLSGVVGGTLVTSAQTVVCAVPGRLRTKVDACAHAWAWLENEVAIGVLVGLGGSNRHQVLLACLVRCCSPLHRWIEVEPAQHVNQK